MLHRVYLHGTICNGGGAFHRLHLGCRGIQERLVRQVDAAELETGVRLSGFDDELHRLTGVQRCALERRGALGKGLLHACSHNS